jgi:hypothetical protein
MPYYSTKKVLVQYTLKLMVSIGHQEEVGGKGKDCIQESAGWQWPTDGLR